MSSADVEFSTMALSTLPFPHTPQEHIEACIPTQTTESDAEGIAANTAQKRGEILSTDAREDTSGRLTTGQRPLDKLTIIGILLFLFLCAQTVAAAGLLLLAYFGPLDISTWLCKYSAPVSYVFYFTQIIGMHLCQMIREHSTVEGSLTHLLKNYATTMVGVLLFASAVLQMMPLYC
ncbi:hypothetical protein CLAIMM_00570 [Cladophialophora immunda]|nr:hypothetical protein CLAIMM_00570 [Cladophialophora immunda]